MVVNPCAARRFAQAHMVRAKTDAIDAEGLLLFLQRMPFQPWSHRVRPCCNCKAWPTVWHSWIRK